MRQECIKQSRQEAGLTQAELAKRVGLQQSSISRIENGKRPLTVDQLWRMAQVLGVKPLHLLNAYLRMRGCVRE